MAHSLYFLFITKVPVFVRPNFQKPVYSNMQLNGMFNIPAQVKIMYSFYFEIRIKKPLVLKIAKILHKTRTGLCIIGFIFAF